MKKITIWYWIVTILFTGFMIFTAIPNVMVTKESVDLISTQLGFPQYFIPFIGWAKLLGCAAVLFPGLHRSIKEWAYAGLFFDIFGAVYGGIALYGFQAPMLTMLLPVIFLFLSHYLWRKKEGLP